MVVDLLPLALLLLGGVVLYRGLRAHLLPVTEAFPLAAACSITALAAVSLLATRAGVFHPWLTGLGCAAAVAAAGIALGRSAGNVAEGQARGPRARRTTSVELAVLLALLIGFGTLYALFPTYFLLGGQDPGLYLSFAANIAKTGALDLDLPVLRDLHARFSGGIILGYPGIYGAYTRGLSTDPAALIPQFVHLFPALLANAWHPFGIEGLVRTNALVTVVGLAIFFAFSRRLLGPSAGLLAVFLLGINPAVIWHARTSLTEPLLLVLTFTGLSLTLIALERRSQIVAFAAGAMLGLGVFDRLDASIAVVAVGGTAFAWLIESGRRGASARRLIERPEAERAAGARHGSERRAGERDSGERRGGERRRPRRRGIPPAPSGRRGQRVGSARTREDAAPLPERRRSGRDAQRLSSFLLVGYGGLAALAFADGYLASRPYLQAAWAAGAVKGLLALNGVVLALASAATLFATRGPTLVWLRGLRRPGAVVLSCVLLAWLVYGYLLRPLHESTFAGRSMMELAWYVTPLALLLSMSGMAWAAWTQRWERWLGWILLATFALILFSWRLLIDPHHPWAARRWLAQVFPAVAFFSTYVIRRLWHEARRRTSRESVRTPPRQSSRRRRSPAKRGASAAGTSRRSSAAPSLSEVLRIGVGVATVAFVLHQVTNAYAFARPYLFRSMLRELPGDYREVVAAMSPGTHLTWNQHVASILTYVYDRPTVHVSQYVSGMEEFPIVGMPPFRVWSATLKLTQEQSRWICGDYVVEEEGRRPDSLIRRCTEASPVRFDYLPEPSPGAAPPGPDLLLKAASSFFGPEVGERQEDGSVRSTGAPGWLLGGPFVQLPNGRYRVSWSGALVSAPSESTAARFEVRAGQENLTLLERELPGSAGPFDMQLEFEMSQPADSVEFPVWVESGVRLELDEFRLTPAPR